MLLKSGSTESWLSTLEDVRDANLQGFSISFLANKTQQQQQQQQQQQLLLLLLLLLQQKADLKLLAKHNHQQNLLAFIIISNLIGCRACN